ncbi:7-keto-8-aminopelargonate synthetase [Shimia gijangensis]|uniref:7-keto-8-aminopelargonate synthetase n=1 Tax=Shimia gijangensis TaxID=1470563 RepID=A0A1M6JSI0_9RHOB|nr:aminotransferase class I/II-fold pyridoxal phosphate-dependent enzyme [Shimia gijangensis]SHJ49560.1 7-keto-8-aminopelargonate synthetase [Shimia gijangensis]
MPPENKSFLTYAERRFRLSGKALIENGHPYFVPTDTLEDSSAQWPDGYLSMSHYDYLGLMQDPETTGAAKLAIDRHGTGVGGSRLVGGERSEHRAFENAMAEFLGVGGVLTIISGYLTNFSLIGHVLGSKDLVIADELSHNSIIMGCKAGRFDFQTYPHNDLDTLDAFLTENREKYARVLIATDGLFSMDGDLTDLPRLLEVKERHDAWLLLDEAHSYGVLGPTGRGLCEHFDLDPKRVELTVGTLSKSFASSGGFIAAEGEVIEWLRFTLPGFVFSVGLPPATIASAHTALDKLQSEPWRVTRLRNNSRHFMQAAQAAGLDTGTAIGEAVVPILFETPEECVFVAESLMDSGIYAPPVVHVGIPKDQPRIRFFISASHTENDLNRVVAAVTEALETCRSGVARISAE